MPPSESIKELVDQAYAALPKREGGRRVPSGRGLGSLRYEVLDHWDKLGWRFAVSVDMSQALRREKFTAFSNHTPSLVHVFCSWIWESQDRAMGSKKTEKLKERLAARF